jgi:hypothetical protein
MISQHLESIFPTFCASGDETDTRLQPCWGDPVGNEIRHTGRVSAGNHRWKVAARCQDLCTTSPEWAPRVSERLRVISIIRSGVLLLNPYTHSGKFSGS